MRIEGQVAIVTGAASGLGSAAVQQLATRGATVVAADLRAPESADVVHHHAVDVTHPAAVEAMVTQVRDRLGPPRILVNCAGILGSNAVVKSDGSPLRLEDFERIVKVNLVGTFNVVRCVAAALSASPRLPDGSAGIVINTGSVAAFDGLSGQAAYSASKGAVVAMTLPLARELGSIGIRVVCIAPGVFETPMVDAVPDETMRVLKEDTPFPKRLGVPQDYARLVVEIVENDMLNGTTIRIDGGLRMREPSH